MDVSLAEFLRTGRFGLVELGMTQAEVQRLLGPPDAVGGTSRRYPRPSIYLYGNVEFSFSDSKPRICTLIQVEMQEWQPRSGVAGTFRFHNLELPSAADAGEVERYLRCHEIDFEWRENPRRLHVPSSGVGINLDEEDRLWSICASLSLQLRSK